MMNIGTSGFRGIIADEFCKDEVCKITQCLANIMTKQNLKKQVVVGYDNRFLSEYFAGYMCEVLVANGINVRITSTSVPSPLVSFANRYLSNDISVIITASHNPYYYNGVKIFSKNGQDLEKDLELMFGTYLPKVRSYHSVPFEQAESSGKVQPIDLIEEYVKSILKTLKFKDNIKTKTLFNAMNGSSVRCAQQLKSALNLDCEIVGDTRDVTFGFSAPIPNEDKLQNFRTLAQSRKVDFAFATDGDGDRLAVFDDKGVYHNGNEICSLIYYFTVKEKHQKGAFVKNFSFSTLADKVCQKLNTSIVQTKVGFKNISQAVNENNGIIGAENSGCEIPSHTQTKDGLVVFALLNEIVSFYNKPLSQILFEMEQDVGYNMSYKEVSFPVLDKQKTKRFFDSSLPDFGKKIVKVDRLDGVKYIFEDGTWLLVRFSGTESLLRLVTEQNSSEAVEKLLNFTTNLVKEVNEE